MLFITYLPTSNYFVLESIIYADNIRSQYGKLQAEVAVTFQYHTCLLPLPTTFM